MEFTEIKYPNIIELNSIGSPELGYITVGEQLKDVPFEIKRTYWTYFTPHNVKRGQHAHRQLDQLIVSVCGSLKMELETIDGKTFEFILDTPNKGLLLHSYTWRKMTFSHNAVLLCLASELYRESDYIREYSEFEILKSKFNAK